MTIKIKVLNLNKTINNMKTIPPFIKRGINKGLKEAGELLKVEIRESIKGNKPEPRSVDTGKFLDSIQIEQKKDSITIFSDVEHSIFLEFGTSRIHERRHFRNSLNRNKINILNIISNNIKR